MYARKLFCARGLWGCVAALALSGCDAFTEPYRGSAEPSAPPSGSFTPQGAGGAGVVIVGIGGDPIQASGAGGAVALAPLDARPVTRARHALPPVSGGTLLAVSGGELAVASDADRDRLVIANVRDMYVEASIPLESGAEPGRLVEDAARRVHVLLRGPGEVASVDLSTKRLVERRAVCETPRGITFDRASERLFVACAQGRLVELPPTGVEGLRTTSIDVDARDVFFAGDRLRFTRFRSAELLELDAARTVVARQALPNVADVSLVEPGARSFAPTVAWRAVPGPEGSTIVVHQRALADVIDVDVRGARATAPPPAGLPLRSAGAENVASARAAIVIPSTGAGSPYGSPNGCGGIVQSAISVVDADGSVATSRELAGILLPVDVAVSSTGIVFVAAAGVARGIDFSGPRFSYAAYSLEDLRAARTGSSGGDSGALVDPCLQPKRGDAGPPAVAVAYVPETGVFLVQTREPAQILAVEPFSLAITRWVVLDHESVADTGYALFHGDAGGIACASCHPEGTEDGHTWHFAGAGPRRTQPLDVGLSGTAPFHWDGSLSDLNALMDEVFTRRMGGMPQGPERVQELERFMANFTPRSPMRSASDPAAARGKVLFESARVGCTKCHSGARLSNGATEAIGKGDLPTQTPSLVGLAYRAPYMHDGCAATLRARFDPVCGGTEHGNVAELGEAELGDLVAYLETL